MEVNVSLATLCSTSSFELDLEAIIDKMENATEKTIEKTVRSIFVTASEKQKPNPQTIEQETIKGIPKKQNKSKKESLLVLLLRYILNCWAKTVTILIFELNNPIIIDSKIPNKDLGIIPNKNGNKINKERREGIY